jgi:hypothetical protein
MKVFTNACSSEHGTYATCYFVLRSDERITITKKDINELLKDPAWREKSQKKYGFMHADIPYGYYPQDPADVRWDKDTVTLVATAGYDICTDDGTLLIKMGDLDHELWRSTLIQAGWFVERDRLVLCQKAPWMRKKQFLSHAPTVNAVHFWLVAHKQRQKYYVSPRPFGIGKGEGGGGRELVFRLGQTHTQHMVTHIPATNTQVL